MQENAPERLVVNAVSCVDRPVEVRTHARDDLVRLDLSQGGNRSHDSHSVVDLVGDADHLCTPETESPESGLSFDLGAEPGDQGSKSFVIH